MNNYDDKFWMNEAIKYAEEGMNKFSELPIASILVSDGKEIGREITANVRKNSLIAHSEYLVLNNATKNIIFQKHPLVLYTTLEPCIMCAGAITSARIKKLVYGATDPRFGACKSLINVFDLKLNHKTLIEGGVLEDKCSALISDFFKKLREN